MDDQKFVEVEQKKFYEIIGPKDVSVRITGKFPYTCEFITPSRVVKGRVVGYMPPGAGLPAYRYYVRETENT